MFEWKIQTLRTTAPDTSLPLPNNHTYSLQTTPTFTLSSPRIRQGEPPCFITTHTCTESKHGTKTKQQARPLPKDTTNTKYWTVMLTRTTASSPLSFVFDFFAGIGRQDAGGEGCDCN